MKSKTIILIIVLFPILLHSCVKDKTLEGDIGTIKVINNSSQNLFLYYSNSYPDTSFSQGRTADCGCGNIKPNTNNGCSSRNGWKDHINSLCKGGKLTLFLFNKDSTTKYTWDTVVSKYMIVKRWELSIEDLEARNWTVTYP